MLERFNEIIEEEIQSRNKHLINQLESTKKAFETTKSKLDFVERENKQLKSELKQIEMFRTFKDLINISNIASVLHHFKLKYNNLKIDGMDCDEIPEWFKLIFNYYEDREKLFTLMDMFNIEYPSWAKNYVMPYEYTKEELEIFIDPKYDRYVCNGQIFDGNIGFFWRNVKSSKGDTYKILTNKNSFEDYIPWQLVLVNPLWTKEEELFDKIVTAIENKQNNSHYFFAISNYQKLNNKQVQELAKLLPKNNLYDVHKKFIEQNKNMIKENVWLAEYFRDAINDNQFSTFYYLNYPLEMQKEFIRKYDKRFYTKLDMIKKMDISKKDKIEFLNEFAEQEFNEKK